jgi:hypothetical protein
MLDWVLNLDIAWMVLVVFAATALITAGIWALVIRLASGDRAATLKGLSPGMLPPMGLVFGLLVGFTAAHVWGGTDRAQVAVNQEASALRATTLLMDSFPGGPQARVDGLIRRHIEQAAKVEWPEMASQTATLTVIPTELAQAVQTVLALVPQTDGQRVAQREALVSLQTALDARRQRIILSESTINWANWVAVLAVAVLTLFAIAVVHADNRGTAALAMGLFAAAVAVCFVLLTAQDRPFAGQFGVGPDVLVQVTPPAR